MGDCRIYCGPKTHRSTEYDLVNELELANDWDYKKYH
jgi:hypothetical protein